MSYLLPHLHSGWAVDQAILAEEERLVVIRFGHDWDETCMQMDEVLASVAETIKNFAVIYLVDITEVPDFNTMYELYDPSTVMFFFRNKHIMIDLGTGNNNKINWALKDKQEFIDIIETVYRGARKGRGLICVPICNDCMDVEDTPSRHNYVMSTDTIRMSIPIELDSSMIVAGGKGSYNRSTNFVVTLSVTMFPFAQHMVDLHTRITPVLWSVTAGSFLLSCAQEELTDPSCAQEEYGHCRILLAFLCTGGVDRPFLLEEHIPGGVWSLPNPSCFPVHRRS
ncbi:hypothetical protein V6N13_005691 [Hibiscus sabdariffa]